jgi:hypothetical protein
MAVGSLTVLLKFIRSLFGINSPAAQLPKVLRFKSPRDAFEHACEYMARPLAQDAELVGYVEGPAQIDPDNRLMPKRHAAGKLAVLLATDQGQFRAQYCGSIAKDFSGREPVAGDLVTVSAASYSPRSREPLNYFLIEVILQPQITLPNHAFDELLRPGLVRKS